MKIICQKEDLLNGIQVVQRVVSTKSTIPILTGIYMSAKGGNLVFKTTDLEIGLEKRVPVEVIEEGAVVIAAKYFTELVRKLPETTLTLTGNENNALTITYGSSTIKVNGFDPEEFPLMPEISGLEEIAISQGIFKNMIRQVIVAISEDEMRPVFTGILVEIKENGEINLVATDTHRLAFRKGSFEGSVTKDRSFIVPGKTMQELIRILQDNDETIVVKFNEKQVFFKREDFSLLSRLIEGQFPAYRQVIPDEFQTSLIFDSGMFSDSIERAALMARDEAKKAVHVVKFHIEEQKMVIEANSAEIGNIHEEIDVEVTGEGMDIAFNAKYLLDALRVLNSEKGILQLSGQVSPGIIRTTENNDYIYLILPVRNV